MYCSKMLSYIAQNVSINFVGVLPDDIVDKTSKDYRFNYMNNDACTPLFEYDRSIANRMIDENRFNPETLIKRIILNKERMYFQRINLRHHYKIIIAQSIILNKVDIFIEQMMIHEDTDDNVDIITQYDRVNMLEFMDQVFTLHGWSDILKYAIRHNAIRCARYCISHHSNDINFDSNQDLLHKAIFYNRTLIMGLMLPFIEVSRSILETCLYTGKIDMFILLSPRLPIQWAKRTIKELSIQAYVLPYRMRHYIIPMMGLILGLIIGMILLFV